MDAGGVGQQRIMRGLVNEAMKGEVGIDHGKRRARTGARSAGANQRHAWFAQFGARPVGRRTRSECVECPPHQIQVLHEGGGERLDLDAASSGLILDQPLALEQKQGLQDWLARDAQPVGQ